MTAPAYRAPTLFSKPLAAVDAGDVDELVRQQLPESDTLELKERLPTKKGDVDVWESARKIADRARNELFDEVIAFANAYGGHVVLGIRESDDHPRRAVAIAPISACTDLAARLRDQARDVIEPELPFVEIAGVPLSADGSGVVVIRVPASRLAPHRLTVTHQSHRRRADRCEVMTMREIQELTLQRAAGMASLESLFAARRADFEAHVRSSARANSEPAPMGVRATLVPSGPLQIDRGYLGSFVPYVAEFILGDGENRMERIMLPHNNFSQRPVVRGTRFHAEYDRRMTVTIDVQESGFVEYRLIEPASDDPALTYLMPEWVLTIAANALATAHALRLAAGVPATEYILEFEAFRDLGQPLLIGGFRANQWNASRGTIEQNPTVFPRYSFGPFEDLANIMGLVASDLFNAAGWRCEPNLYRLIGPPPTLERVRLGVLIARG